MNPLRSPKWLRAAVLITALLCVPAPQARAQQTAIEKLAEVLGDALKAATGREVKQKAAVARQVLAQPAMPAVLTPEAELKARKVRLDAFRDVSIAWLDGTVSLADNQQLLLEKTLDQAIASSQVAAKKPQANNQRMNRGYVDHFAITFTDTDGAARKVDLLHFEKLLAETDLTPEQAVRLAAAAKERREFHQSATLGHILNILDAELYFTAGQRTAIGDAAREKIQLNSACYALRPMNYYFQQTPITPLLKRGNHLNVLSEAQKRRATDLSATNTDNAEQYVSFQSNEGIDLWQDTLRNAIKAQRERLTRAVAVRVDFHQALNEMSDSDARHLQVAGKGATDAAIARWKTTSRQQLKTFEQHAMGAIGNFSFSLQVPNVDQIDADGIWKHSMEQLVPKSTDQLNLRDSVRLEATAKFVVAMLDKELWLTKAQREILIDAVRKELPSPDTKIQNANYFLEVTLLTIPMFKLSKRELSVLTDTQKAAFEAMKKPFQKQNSYILVQMQNGGQMHLQIPK